MQNGIINNSATKNNTTKASCIIAYITGNIKRNKKVPSIMAAILYIIFISINISLVVV